MMRLIYIALFAIAFVYGVRIGGPLGAPDLAADTLHYTSTRGDAFVKMGYLSLANPTTNTGNTANLRLGGAGSTDDSNVIYIYVSCDSAITHGVTSSNLDSVKVRINNITNEFFDKKNVPPEADTLLCALFKFVASDTDWAETDPTWNDRKSGSSWDTAGTGYGNDVVAIGTKSEAFGDASVNDTFFYFYQVNTTTSITMVNQKGTTYGDIINGTFEFFLPLADFQNYMDGNAEFPYMIKDYRRHDYQSDDQCGLRFDGDDGTASNQMDVFFFYTPTSAAEPTRRRRITAGMN